jgi:hypothetical protein
MYSNVENVPFAINIRVYEMATHNNKPLSEWFIANKHPINGPSIYMGMDHKEVRVRIVPERLCAGKYTPQTQKMASFNPNGSQDHIRKRRRGHNTEKTEETELVEEERRATFFRVMNVLQLTIALRFLFMVVVCSIGIGFAMVYDQSVPNECARV